jgi:hypothetical protein
MVYMRWVYGFRGFFMDWIGILTEHPDVGYKHIFSTLDNQTIDKKFSLNEELLPDTIDNLKPCPLCHGRDFIHGHKGGYFCIICQPSARPGDPVKAGGYRAKNANDTKM